jgi:prepilin-type N-terminal cleavage/methylation domain-containing protein
MATDLPAVLCGPTCRPLARRPGRRSAFTLIELLVVIAIMTVLAGLIVALARHASEQKKLSRVTADLAKWSSMIDNYHEKLGFYPPNNPANPYGPAVTPLFYELAGAELSGTTYTTLTTRDTIDKATVLAAFGLNGLVNSATEQGESTSFGRNIQAADLIIVTLPGVNAPIKLPGVPVMGPPPYGSTNTWHYNSVKPEHNPNSYDLWAELLIGGKTNIIGNWKR